MTSDRRGRTTSAIGSEAERAAEDWLRAQGLRPLARNYRTPFGELDLVMLDGDVLVFVEVRYRRRVHFGTPEETVQSTKRHRLVRTAERFLQRHPTHINRRCRFDVISMTGPHYGPTIRWLKDAFTH